MTRMTSQRRAVGAVGTMSQLGLEAWDGLLASEPCRQVWSKSGPNESRGIRWDFSKWNLSKRGRAETYLEEAVLL